MVKKKRKTTGKSSITFSLTSQAHDRLAEMAQKSGFSRSAFLENVMAGKVAIASPEAEKNLAVTVEDATATPPKLQVAVVDDLQSIAASTSTAESASSGAATDQTAKMTELETKIAEQAKHITELKNKLDQKVAVQPTPVRRVETKPENSQKHSQELKAKDTEIATLKARIDNYDAQVQTLKEQSTGLEKNLTENATMHSTLQQEVARKDRELKENQEQTKTLEKQLEEQYSRVSNLAKEVAKQNAKNEVLEQLELRLKEANTQGDRLTKQLDDNQVIQQQLQDKLVSAESLKTQLENQLSTADLEKTGLQEQISGAKALEQELQTQKATLAELQTELYNERQLVNRLKAQLEAVEKLRQDYALLQTEHRNQGDRLVLLESQANQNDSISGIGERYLNRWQKYMS
ncbi:MAG: hypothetical protein WBB82_00915 [Limnothrix sp.]